MEKVQNVTTTPCNICHTRNSPYQVTIVWRTIDSVIAVSVTATH